MYSSERIRKITTIGMLCALSYVVMFVGRIPISTVEFLKYDPKDIIIVIGGFIYGPLAAFIISFIVSFFEMITVSSTGFPGLIMNVLSTCSFACTAAFIYKRNRKLKGAVIGLITGCLLMTGTMILWNYLITPLYMEVSREVVVKMLIPTFLPFNLLKSSMNLAVTMIVYKPSMNMLRKLHMLPDVNEGENKSKINAGAILLSLVLLVTCILVVLSIRGVI